MDRRKKLFQLVVSEELQFLLAFMTVKVTQSVEVGLQGHMCPHHDDQEAGNEAGAKSEYNCKRLSSVDLILLSRL